MDRGMGGNPSVSNRFDQGGVVASAALRRPDSACRSTYSVQPVGAQDSGPSADAHRRFRPSAPLVTVLRAPTGPFVGADGKRAANFSSRFPNIRAVTPIRKFTRPVSVSPGPYSPESGYGGSAPASPIKTKVVKRIIIDNDERLKVFPAEHADDLEQLTQKLDLEGGQVTPAVPVRLTVDLGPGITAERIYFLTDQGLSVCAANGRVALVTDYSVLAKDPKLQVVQPLADDRLSEIHAFYTAFSLQQSAQIPEGAVGVAFNFEPIKDVAEADHKGFYGGLSRFIEGENPFVFKYDHDVTTSSQVTSTDPKDMSTDFYLFDNSQKVVVHVYFPFLDQRDGFGLFEASIKQWIDRGNVDLILGQSYPTAHLKGLRDDTDQSRALRTFKQSPFWRTLGLGDLPVLKCDSYDGVLSVNTGGKFGAANKADDKTRFIIRLSVPAKGAEGDRYDEMAADFIGSGFKGVSTPVRPIRNPFEGRCAAAADS